jgi:hypothetical protein
MNIDPKIIKAMGIDLDKSKEAELLKHIESKLGERIGLAVLDTLDDNEVRELISLQKKGNTKTIASWLTVHVPDYKEIIKDEYYILMGELADNAALI